MHDLIEQDLDISALTPEFFEQKLLDNLEIKKLIVSEVINEALAYYPKGCRNRDYQAACYDAANNQVVWQLENGDRFIEQRVDIEELMQEFNEIGHDDFNLYISENYSPDLDGEYPVKLWSAPKNSKVMLLGWLNLLASNGSMDDHQIMVIDVAGEKLGLPKEEVDELVRSSFDLADANKRAFELISLS